MIEKQNLQKSAILTILTSGGHTVDLRSNLRAYYRKICKRAIECFFQRPPNPYSSRATASFVGKCRPQSDYGEI